MSDVIRFTLRDDVNWVNADNYPDTGGCNLLCLTDRQLSTVRQLVGPSALLPERFVVPGWDRRFTYPDADLATEHFHEVEALIDKLGGGTTMDCQSMLDALDTIATRLVPSALVAVSDFTTSLAAGAQTRSIYTCAQYKVAHITTVGYMYAGTAPSLLLITMRKSGGSAIAFTAMKPPVTGIYYWWSGLVTLLYGDSIEVGIYNGTLNDDLTVFLNGYLIDVPA